MARINCVERIIKEKSEFIERNAIKLYNMRGNRGFCGSSTIEEALLSILLSDKPLVECNKYQPLNEVLISLDDDNFSLVENENYPLKVVFSATRYVNSATVGEEQIKLRDRLRKYLKYIDTRTPINSEIKVCDEDKEKVLQKK